MMKTVTGFSEKLDCGSIIVSFALHLQEADFSTEVAVHLHMVR
jgi:hypothetical protein